MAFFGRPSNRDEVRAANWTNWFQRQHPFALASLPLSVFSLTHAGTLWVDEIAGIVLGVLALRQLARPPAACDTGAPPVKSEGHLLAWGGVVIGTVSLALALAIYFVLPPHRG